MARNRLDLEAVHHGQAAGGQVPKEAQPALRTHGRRDSPRHRDPCRRSALG